MSEEMLEYYTARCGMGLLLDVWGKRLWGCSCLRSYHRPHSSSEGKLDF